ncbi:MAG: helical backbone metal receptor [Terasakiella sp.]|uniref:helical backbone metal receptor n=1 Tax=unclassified Terasakiella TaxID=2614952 RepID=UPI003B001C0D
MFIDAIGQSHQTSQDARIISLVPSITELLFDMGLGAQVVGRTVFCVHPKDQVKQVRSIGGTKQVNMDKVKALNATHLIVNVDENPKELVDELAEFIPHIVVTHPNTPSDNIDLFSLIGNIFNKKGEAARLISDFQAALTHAQLTAQGREEKNVLYFIWKDPWMTVAGETYISQALRTAHMISQPQTAEIRYPEINLESGILDEVDAILFSSEPFLFKQHHLDEFSKEFDIPADKLHIIDGEMTSWYGSRAIVGIRYLAQFAQKLSNEA